MSFIYAVLIAQTSGDLYDNRYIWFFAGFLLACDTMWHAEPRSVNRQGGPPAASFHDGIQGI